jgi:hypothetical protein
MRLVLLCFALVVLSFTFVATARAQSLENNEHYQAFRSWAIDTQQPDPVPNMFKFCIQAYDKMIASGVSLQSGFDVGPPSNERQNCPS